MQQFRDEQPFPEFSADEVPVEKRMLEDESERENEFAVKNRVVKAERERECDHEERYRDSGKQAQLENVPEERTCSGAVPEKGEN